ncbi:MAG: apolipoprotein N-acyltransferase [Alphaproteobacteria bacterium]|nr:MAG: apolipoprotein N-acyltransferase [Alphaproteobacteria bacterium]
MPIRAGSNEFGYVFGLSQNAPPRPLKASSMERLTALYHFVSQMKGRRRLLLAFVLGAVMPLALAPFYVVPVLFVSFTGLVWLLDGLPWGARAWRQAALVGWAFGFGFHLTGLYWIGFAFMVDAESFAWAIPFAVTLMPAGLAIFFAGAAALAHRFWSEGPDRIWTLALALILFEWLRGHILTGFPWNLIGYTWMGFLPVAQAGALIGIYGLTLLSFALFAAPAALVSGQASRARLERRGVVFAFAHLGLFALIALGGTFYMGKLSRQGVEGVTLRLAQGSIPQKEKWADQYRYRNFDLYLEMTKADAGTDHLPTHIIWPESAVPLFLANNEEARQDISKAMHPGQILLTGAVRFDRVDEDGLLVSKLYNAFHTLNSDGEVTGTYDKFHLVPFGEYLPLTSLLSRIGLKKLTEGVGSYSAGTGPQSLAVPGTGKVMPLICYEVIFPGRMPEGPRPQWMLNVTNDAWYGNTTGPRQHLAQAQMRAIEQGLPLVRSANNGISAVIDGYGRIWSRLPLNTRGVLQSPLPKPLPQTLYGRFGDSLFWVICMVVLLSNLFWRRVTSKKHPHADEA